MRLLLNDWLSMGLVVVSSRMSFGISELRVRLWCI